MNLYALLFREVKPKTRKCILCDAVVLLVEDENGDRLALDEVPVEGTYILAPTTVLRTLEKGNGKAAGAIRQQHHTSHADTCTEKRRRT